MSLCAGDSLGPYQIVNPIGSGGMGTVYRARDTRLQRDVAIKVSSGRFSERFEREARTVAQLNHASICTLFDVGPDYLVMELIEGETLARRLTSGPMPADETLRIAQQIAEALDAAHEHGIVHRDLKPGNVMIRPDGRVKVLDFGLAKMGGTPTVANADSPTISMETTQAGVILGTASYMAPEQAMGKPTDKRADVYAFGAVVYEMLTGQRLHRGTTTTEVLASVIKDEPQWDKVPLQFQRVLRSCLTKDPQQRLKHIGDVMRLADDSSVTSAALPVAAMPRAARRGSWWLVVATLLVLVAIASWWFLGRSTPRVEALRFQILEDGQYKLQNANPAVSPDGKFVAFAAPGIDGMSHIWLRALDSLETRAIPGTESANLLAAPPFWSFDSKSIVFAVTPAPFAPGQLKRVDIAGGTPQLICNIVSSVAGVAWSPQGIIVFLETGKRYLQRIPASGGEPTPITSVREGEIFHLNPQFLPDGRRFLYHRRTNFGKTEGIYIGSLDVQPEQQSLKPILLTNRQAYYSPVGGDHLLFLRDQTLFAQPFDPRAGALSGEPVPVADGVSSFAPAGVGNFSVSENGVLAYNSGAATVGSVTLSDRSSGKVLQTLGEQDALSGMTRFSPDSMKLARPLTESASGTTNIWVTDIATGNNRKVTFGSGRNINPVWSPDGQYIIFASNRNGTMDLYLKKADGSGEERLILKTPQEKVPTSWSQSGFLLFNSNNGTNSDLWVLPHPESGNSQPVPYLQTMADELWGQFSPDGKWIAYVSSESGARSVYVRPFDPEHIADSAATGHWLLSRGNGQIPFWTRNGRELMYVSQQQHVVAQEVDAAKPYEPKGAVTDILALDVGIYAVSPDGNKLVRIFVPAGDVPGRLVVVKNWHAVLQK